MEINDMYPPCALQQVNLSAFETEFKSETKPLSSCRFETDPLAVQPQESKNDIKPIIEDSIRAQSEFSIRSILSEKIEIKEDVHIKRNCPSTENFMQQGARIASPHSLLAASFSGNSRTEVVSEPSYPSAGQLFTCNVSNKSFPFLSELQTNQDIDTREHSTVQKTSSVNPLQHHSSYNVCSRSMESTLSEQNNVHIENAAGKSVMQEQPYCNICCKSFAFKQRLLRHMLTMHSGSRPRYACPCCDKTLATESGLKVHMFIHTGNAPYSCDVCDQKFAFINQLNNHKASHSEERLFVCHICGYRFNLKVYLERHLFRHTGQRPFTCSRCNKTFMTKWYLRTHQQTVHKLFVLGENKKKLSAAHARVFTCGKCNKTFKQLHKLKNHKVCESRCDICGKSFLCLQSLVQHKRVIHSDQRPKYPCSYCDKILLSEKSLKNHIMRHTGEAPYNCDVCDTKFACISTLKSHKISHSDEKLFVCHICGYRCKQKGHLQLHLFRHTGERPFACADCNKTYKRKCDLVDHQQKFHKTVQKSNKNMPVHTCSKCNRKFKRKCDLYNHKICQKEKRVFNCEICGKSFTRQESVKRHMGVHTEERPFTCQVCNRSFREKWDFSQHQLTHAGDRLHVCQVCNKSFIRLRSLKEHQKKYHS